PTSIPRACSLERGFIERAHDNAMQLWLLERGATDGPDGSSPTDRADDDEGKQQRRVEDVLRRQHAAREDEDVPGERWHHVLDGRGTHDDDDSKPRRLPTV